MLPRFDVNHDQHSMSGAPVIMTLGAAARDTPVCSVCNAFKCRRFTDLFCEVAQDPGKSACAL